MTTTSTFFIQHTYMYIAIIATTPIIITIITITIII